MKFKVLQDFVLDGREFKAGDEFDASAFEPDVLPDLQSRGLVESPDAPEPVKAKKSK